jgi:hypothetical protein
LLINEQENAERLARQLEQYALEIDHNESYTAWERAREAYYRAEELMYEPESDSEDEQINNFHIVDQMNQAVPVFNNPNE